MMSSDKHPWAGLTTKVEDTFIVDLSPLGGTALIAIHRAKMDPRHNHKGRFLWHLHTPLYVRHQRITQADSATSIEKSFGKAMTFLRVDFARAKLAKENKDAE